MIERYSNIAEEQAQSLAKIAFGHGFSCFVFCQSKSGEIIAGTANTLTHDRKRLVDFLRSLADEIGDSIK